MLSFKSYMFSLMRDKRVGFPHVMVKAVLRFLSWIYAQAVRVVALGYKTGLRRRYRVGAPVVSVGNITLGGTGKTPFVMFIADYFLARERKPAVLIRGYGGDENRMLASELPEVPVFVGQDRVKEARGAVRAARDVLVLDDGFQHRRIERDLDILLLDAFSPFGNGCLFPRGVLREPISSVRRANIFVLTKTDRINTADRENIIRRLAVLAPGKPVVLSRHKPSFLSDITGAVYAIDTLRHKRVLLFSGIADPDYFAFLIEKQGAVIVSRHDHDDHHRYSDHDIGVIRARCAREKAEIIITTAKDYVKVRDLDLSGIEEKIFVMNIVIDIVEGKENLVAGLNSVISCKRA
ncbi:MAG: tetraacyldisaccharide 4'-kinase [Candidatus Omnitrophota bacterium]